MQTRLTESGQVLQFPTQYLGNNTHNKYSAIIAGLATLGEEMIKEGDAETACQAFQLVLRVDPGNERATLSLCSLIEDCYEARTLLKTMLEFHPNNSLGQRMLQEAEARYSALEELEAMVQNSDYLKSWQDREQQHEERLRYAKDRRDAPITKIGTLLLRVGYISEEQLETAVSLQTMLARFEEKQPLGKILLDYGYISQTQLDDVLRMQEVEYQSQMY